MMRDAQMWRVEAGPRWKTAKMEVEVEAEAEVAEALLMSTAQLRLAAQWLEEVVEEVPVGHCS